MSVTTPDCLFPMQASEELLKQHYIDLKDRPFYAGLVQYMKSGPVVAMVIFFAYFLEGHYGG